MLRKECGVPMVSLANANTLLHEVGPATRVVLFMGEEWETRVEFDGRVEHTFTGFAWGYGGEGPRGLASFAQLIGLPLAQETIAILPKRPGTIAAWRLEGSEWVGADAEITAAVAKALHNLVATCKRCIRIVPTVPGLTGVEGMRVWSRDVSPDTLADAIRAAEEVLK